MAHGERRMRSGAVIAACCCVALGVGCEREDPAARALSEASASLRAMSPGSVPPASEGFAQSSYEEVSGRLAGIGAEASDAQQSAAALLRARVEVGKAHPAIRRLGEIEQRVGLGLGKLASLESARASARQTADALAAYDPSGERQAIDARVSSIQDELAATRERREELQGRISDLNTRIEGLNDQAEEARQAEAELRSRALNEDPIRAADTLHEAREVQRRADRLEVRASELDAQIAVLTPRVEELGVQIDALETQLSLLADARATVDSRAEQADDDARAEAELAREHAAELRAVAEEIATLELTEAQEATDEVVASLERAASTAGRARGGAQSDGRLSAAGTLRSLGDLLARRSASLRQAASTFRALADNARGENATRLAALAGQLDQRADARRAEAVEAYEGVVNALRGVRASGEAREALQAAADTVEALAQGLADGQAGG